MASGSCSRSIHFDPLKGSIPRGPSSTHRVPSTGTKSAGPAIPVAGWRRDLQRTDHRLLKVEHAHLEHPQDCRPALRPRRFHGAHRHDARWDDRPRHRPPVRPRHRRRLLLVVRQARRQGRTRHRGRPRPARLAARGSGRDRPPGEHADAAPVHLAGPPAQRIRHRSQREDCRSCVSPQVCSRCSTAARSAAWSLTRLPTSATRTS